MRTKRPRYAVFRSSCEAVWMNLRPVGLNWHRALLMLKHDR
jgi:hypothetical protein